MEQRTVLGAADIARAVTRISHEIIESNHGFDELVLLGIPTRGQILAKRICDVINQAHPDAVVGVGSLDVTMYRDDLAANPTRTVGQTTIPAQGVSGKTVVLVDDVLYSGRTVRAALDALNDYGRPKAVRLAVLVDRGHRELPIRADFVGKNIPSSSTERVSVRFSEIDSIDEVVIG